MNNPRTLQILSGVLVAALVVVGTSFILDERAESIDTFLAHYPLIDPTRHLVPQEDFIVNLQPLREKMRMLSAEFEAEGGDVSLYVEFLNTGGNISINQDKYLFPASLTKVPIALVVMKKIESGDWSPNNELVLRAEDRNKESGDAENPLAEYPVGTRFTIEKLLEELLVNSDNTAALMLSRNIHEDELEAIILDLGLEDLFTAEGRYSAKEYSRIFRSLYTSSFLTREGSERILEWLDEATFNNFITAPVPAEIPFPHKYGAGGGLAESTFYADAGIAYLPNRPYLITVMVEGEQTIAFENRATAFMRAVSKEAYEYFSSYEK